VLLYRNWNNTVPYDYYGNFPRGFNFNLNVYVWKINLELNHNINLETNFYDMSGHKDITFYPAYSGNATISYHSMHFKDKLEVKVGLTSKYFASFYAPVYDGYSNDFYIGYDYLHVPGYSESGIKLNSNATLDFFVVGKIDKAVFGITFENLLNRAVISTNYYPNQQRGGLFNVWSRFNITWYFLN
ncbi:MAG: hypothetical protein ACHQJ4_06165, partial [Ignavibacteria bacterium]